ncbi:MAG: acetate--CoA ligase family protein [Gammaproteobacteria bacterium]
MSPALRANLRRLLQPRAIAFIGGRDAETAIGECRRIGFSGGIWPVNPKRETLGGLRCYAHVDALPHAPDAAFIAVPARAAIAVVAALARRGGGGAVCYTAGFDAAGERALCAAAGDLALVGPNCYGFINYLDKVALWPFAHGGDCPGYGAAIITQSGMLSSDITMNRRSAPLACMISAGNQSKLQIEDYMEALCEREQVRAIGLHIEGLRDINAFCRAARRALECGKPVVALKTGASKIGAKLTLSHTNSLSGANELYQALFEKLGIIRVSSPAQLLETLKFLCVCGAPRGPRVMGFTCSGGGATMLADHAAAAAVEFRQPGKRAAAAMARALPAAAEVSNPLDYTTPIWGIAEKVRRVFDAALSDAHDAALLVQDYPRPGLDESKAHYRSDARCFIEACARAGLPGAVCSTLPENLDRQTREWLIAHDIAPLQGLPEAMNALGAAAWHGRMRECALARAPARLVSARGGALRACDEWESKSALAEAGIKTPAGKLAAPAAAPEAACAIGFPVALKINAAEIAHKTEIGAVRLGLESAEEVARAVREMRAARARAGADAGKFLVEQMLPPPLAELLLSVRADAQFGLALTLSAGGVLAEALADAVTLLLPAEDDEICAALARLKIAPLLNGYRGRAAVNQPRLVEIIGRFADYAIARRERIAEIEINPLFVFAEDAYAVDARMHRYREAR